MRQDWSHLENWRLRNGPYASNTGDTFGFFFLTSGKRQLRAMACDGAETGWEHVSVSVLYKNDKGKLVEVMPTWDDMCTVKAYFFTEDEAVIQFHPPASEYVNQHKACLHLWKCVAQEFPLPPSILVGEK